MNILLSTKIMMDMFNFSFHVWRETYVNVIHSHTIFNVDSLWEIRMCIQHKKINYIFGRVIRFSTNLASIKWSWNIVVGFFLIAFQNFSLPQFHFLSQQHLNNDILKTLHIHKYIGSWRLHNYSFFPSPCNIQNHA